MVDQAVITRKMTFDEFMEAYPGEEWEFVDGQAVARGEVVINDKGEMVVMRPKFIHGLIVAHIQALLILFLYGKKLGKMLSEMGFFMTTDPEEQRAADVAFFSQERLEGAELYKGWLPFPPDFAVEVISEFDKAADVRRKIRSYMEHGTRLLWAVYPIDREIEVYRPGEVMQIATEADMLDGGEVLPGWTVKVSEIFSVLTGVEQE